MSLSRDTRLRKGVAKKKPPSRERIKLKSKLKIKTKINLCAVRDAAVVRARRESNSARPGAKPDVQRLRSFQDADPVASLSIHIRSGSTYNPPISIVADSVLPKSTIPGGLPARHLLVEFFEADALDQTALIETALRSAVSDAKATLIHLALHTFSTGGVSATAALAESHVAIHTWPEEGYAAIDIFMCGACNPRSCLPSLINTLSPQSIHIREIIRGSILSKESQIYL